jgi:replicative DNA helicase
MKEISMQASDIYAMRYKSKMVVTGVASGLHDLDALTFGFHPGDLTILAARPAMGKTALALNICRYAAESGIASIFMSLEMPRIQLCDRLITMETEINGNIVRIGRFTPEQFQRVNDACSSVYNMPIYVDDRGGLEFNEVRRVIRRQAKLHPEVKFAIIDHLQLIRGRNPQNRNLELGEISGGLKALAKELRIAIICLSQLNRGLESRNNPYKRPKLSDLRDSGSIEQDADNVIFIYRPWVYGDTQDPVNPNVELQISEEDCELIVAKQRQGATGTAKCLFFDKIQLFKSYSKLSPDEIYKQRGMK